MQGERKTKEGAGLNVEGKAGEKEGDSRSRESIWGCMAMDEIGTGLGSEWDL